MPKPFRHALVIGKFYPPHDGHHYLIRAAALGADRVTVAVLCHSGESIPIGLRVAWLSEAFAAEPGVTVVGRIDDAPIDYHSDAAWAAHLGIMRIAVADAARLSGGDTRIDAVFSSESYGARLAEGFGAAHVAVDPGRAWMPVSGTAVRTDPLAYWDRLAPSVQAWLCRKVVVIGAESTGTTTLAGALAAHYRARGGVFGRTRSVPEYGRELSAVKLALLQAKNPAAGMNDITWDEADFVDVALVQNRWEDEAARLSGPLLICDTDSLATCVWHERYRGGWSAQVAAIAAQASAKVLYLLTDHADVPFEQDGLRDGEHLRGWMTKRFATLLAERGLPTIRLTGSHEARLAHAVTAIDALFAHRWGLVDPPAARP